VGPGEAGGSWIQVHMVQGPSDRSQFGLVVGGVGDLDGDGREEWAVTAPKNDPGGLKNAGSVFVYSGLDGSQVYQMDGAHAGDLIGLYSLVRAGDINGDGVPDFLVSGQGGTSGNGSVWLFSGKDGSLLRRQDGAAPGDFFGFDLASIPDSDGDLVKDYAVVAQGADPGGLTDAGSVLIYSGVDGSLLNRIDGLAPGESISSIGSLGDLNGDGVSDLLVGVPGASPNGKAGAGVVRIVSGADSSLLLEIPGQAKGDGFGSVVGAPGDTNLDGFPDFLVAAPFRDTNGFVDSGTVFLFSGADQSVLFSVNGNRDFGGFEDFLPQLTGGGDLNGDGYPEALISSETLSVPGLGGRDVGALFVVSGKTSNLLQELFGFFRDAHFGHVGALGDLDGDGLDDLVASIFRFRSPDGIQRGAAWVCAFHPHLTADGEALSAAAGGTIHFDLDFPVEDANLAYTFLGSLHGTGPTSIGGVEVPLTDDKVFQLSLAGNLPASLFSGATGSLDSAGKATVTLSAAPNALPAKVIGRQSHWAALVRNPDSTAKRSSVAVSVRFDP